MSEITPDKKLDERGKICPYPDVDTMTALKKMNKGEVLEVIVDYPMSIERIPRSAKKWGHKVLASEPMEGTDHRFLIEVQGHK
jgi:tRNA 2-thiouridine synthesizing protein A